MSDADTRPVPPPDERPVEVEDRLPATGAQQPPTRAAARDDAAPTRWHTRRLREALVKNAERLQKEGKEITYRVPWSVLVDSMSEVLEELGIDPEAEQAGSTRRMRDDEGERRIQAELEATWQERDDALARTVELKAALGEAEAEVARVRAKRTALRAELAQARAALEEAQADLTAVRADAEALQGDLDASQTEAAELRAALGASRAETAAARRRGEDLEESLRETREAAAAARERAREERERLEERARGLEEALLRQRDGLEREVDRVRAERDRLDAALRALLDAMDDGEREALAALAVPGAEGVDVEAARRGLQRLLERLDRYARERRTAVLLPEPPFDELLERLEGAAGDRLARLRASCRDDAERYAALKGSLRSGRGRLGELLELRGIVERALGRERELDALGL